ncbi:MAG: nucleotidyltransferase [Chloroflexi bacterium]|nr:nucleotidyltransferase [Chloroflexota bacterium]
MGSAEAFAVVVRVMNELKKRRVIKDYAIYGAFAVLKYTEPFHTGDLDVCVLVKSSPIINLSPIYGAFTRLGYAWKGEHIIVEGFPVEFMAADKLEAEAMLTANVARVGGKRVKVLSPEYLIALAVRAGRPKDISKLFLLLEQAKVRQALLDDILVRYRLRSRFERVTSWVRKESGPENS